MPSHPNTKASSCISVREFYDVLGVWPLHGINDTWGGSAAGFILYKVIDMTYGLRMTDEEQLRGSDLTYHNISDTNYM